MDFSDLRRAADHLPLIRSLAGYRPRDLGSDLVAGLLITATAVPLGVGFAQAAGLPPIMGLYTSMLPLVVFGLFSSTRQVKLGLDAAAAAMIASAIVPLATVDGAVDTALLTSLVAVLGLATGAILLLAGALRAGFLADLLSAPLLVGYQAGIAIGVIVGQIPKLLGYPARPGSDVVKAVGIVADLASTHGPTLAVGASALAVLLVLRRLWPSVPGALVVLVVFTAASMLLDLQASGVATVGPLPSGIPAFALPDFSVVNGRIETLLGTAASLALVLASDTLIASRTFAVRGRYRVSANTDIAALGLTQVASALGGGAVASASYTRTAISERVGSRTQISSILGGAFMIVVVATMTGLLAHIPLAVLGAICIDACLHLVEIPAFVRLWRLRRTEFLIAVLTCVLVLATDPLLAIGAAVVVSLVSFLRRAIWPDESRLGRRKGIDGWYPLDDYDDAAVTDATVVVYQWNAPLIFANAPGFLTRLREHCTPTVRWVVLDCAAIFDLDPSAADVLDMLVDDLSAEDIDLVFADPAPDVARMLRDAGLLERLGPEPHMFVDVDTALAAIGHGTVPKGTLADPNGDGVYEYVEQA